MRPLFRILCGTVLVVTVFATLVFFAPSLWHFIDLSAFRDLCHAADRKQTLEAKLVLARRRQETRWRVHKDIIAGRMTLLEAAEVVRRTDAEDPTLVPVEEDEACRQILDDVAFTLESTGHLRDQQDLLARLDREFVQRFGTQPVMATHQPGPKEEPRRINPMKVAQKPDAMPIQRAEFVLR